METDSYPEYTAPNDIKYETTPENDTGIAIAQKNDTREFITPHFTNRHTTDNLLEDTFWTYNEYNDNPTMQSLITTHVHEAPGRDIGTKSPETPPTGYILMSDEQNFL